eukprot:5836703-Alexandrium_andersonii.AAC.1
MQSELRTPAVSCSRAPNGMRPASVTVVRAYRALGGTLWALGPSQLAPGVRAPRRPPCLQLFGH